MKSNSYFLYVLNFLYTVLNNILYNDNYDYRDSSSMYVREGRVESCVSEPF